MDPAVVAARADRELPGRVAALPARAAPAPACGLRIRPARGHPRRRGRGRPARAPRRARGARSTRCYDGRADVAGDAAAPADDPGVRPAARAVPPADRGNRMDQRISSTTTWADLERYCDHSADPVGRLVLGLLRRADDAELVRSSDDVCTGLQLVNFLQDVPRDLALGRDLPARRGPPPLRRDGARRAERAADPAAPLRGGARTRPARRRADAPASRSAAGSGAPSASSRAAGSPRWTRSRTPAGTSSRSARGRRGSVSRGRRSGGESRRRAGLRRGRAADPRARARNFAYGIMVLPKPKRRAIAAIYAFAREVDDMADGDAPTDEKRAPAGGAAPARSTSRRTARRCGSPSPTRGSGSRSRRRRSTTSSTAA